MEESAFMLPNLDEFQISADPFANGPYGTIYKAKIKATEQYVAMKKPSVPNNDYLYESLINEFKLMCKLSHPALQKLVGLYEDKNDATKTALVTPFCENGSLHDVIQKDPPQFNLTAKTSILYGISKAMEYLHNNSVAHRDLKPQNVLIDSNFRPKIADFGVSRQFDPKTMMNTEAGTAIYMAPEILDGGKYDESVDVYSFGLIIYEMFAGHHPYQNITTIDELRNIKKSDLLPEMPHTMPQLFKDIASKCLKVNPAERMTFEQISDKILIGSNYSSKLKINRTSFQGYVQFIECEERREEYSFKIPKVIVKKIEINNEQDLNQAVEGHNPNNPNENLKEIKTSPVDMVKLIEILTLAGNRPIIIIMVFGKFESGKTTFLRTLTGNSAYYPGKSTKSQTQGILIDGPYSAKDLICRIDDDSDIKNACQDLFPENSEIDPAIFIFDTQGTGNKNYVKYQEQILDRVNSMFTSVSTICLNIIPFTEIVTNMQNTLSTIRRAQLTSMASGSSSCSKVIFLIRDYEKVLEMMFQESSIEEFENAMPQFTEPWWNEHDLSSEHYFLDSIIPLPLGNLSNLNLYYNTVWYSLYKMLEIIKATDLCEPEKIRDKIFKSLTKIDEGLFGKEFIAIYNKIMKFESNPNIPKSNEDTDEPNSPQYYKALQHCCSCCCSLSSIIAEVLFSSSSNAGNAEQIVNGISNLIETVTGVILPYVIGNDNIPCMDFVQYSIEISKDCISYAKKSNNSWKKFIDLMKNEKAGIIGSGVSVFALFGVATAAIATLPVSAPAAVVLAGATLAGLSTGYSASVFTYEQVMSGLKRKTGDDRMTTLYPQLWKNNLSPKPPQKFNDTDKLISQIAKRNDPLIVYYDQKPNVNSKLIIQAITGVMIDIPVDSTDSNLIELLDTKALMSRLMRFSKEKTSSLPPKIGFLYLKSVTQKDMNLIESTRKRPLIFVTSVIKNEKPLIFPSKTATFRILFLSDQVFVSKPVDKLTYKEEMDRVSRENHTKEIPNAIYLPICTDSYEFDKRGPRCHVSLRYSARCILQDPKMDLC